jgi:hypothetical protein
MMDDLTTRTDEVRDVNIVDMGYHYKIPNPADFDGDDDVDLADYAVLAAQWLSAPGTPSADIEPLYGDGIVDEFDLSFLCRYWLSE